MNTVLEKVLSKITENLEITDNQMKNIVSSYNAVADWLDEGDEFKKFGKVSIFPQGSVGLGTVVRPINDEYDVDMVITINSYSIPALSLKHMVGNRLKEHEKYKSMLDTEGKRCWTLNYSDDLNYHMDILPTEKDESPIVYQGIPSIKATNFEKGIYSFHSTNPEAYKVWFLIKASNTKQQVYLREDVDRIKTHTKKTVLQKTVQLLKRHRDIMFDGKDDKPISIIITTLVAEAYNGEESLYESLKSVISRMNDYIEYDGDNPVVRNPVDNKENFANRWIQEPNKKDAFFFWLKKATEDIRTMEKLDSIQLGKFLMSVFGERVVTHVYESIGDEIYNHRERGNLRMEKQTGVINLKEGAIVKPHTFYGKKAFFPKTETN